LFHNQQGEKLRNPNYLRVFARPGYAGNTEERLCNGTYWKDKREISFTVSLDTLFKQLRDTIGVVFKCRLGGIKRDYAEKYASFEVSADSPKKCRLVLTIGITVRPDLVLFISCFICKKRDIVLLIK
jgi:hypothetical protein